VRRPATIVVPAYGDAEALTRLLGHLDRQAGDGEPLPVIVADDGSPDPLADELGRQTYRRLALEILRNESNRGPGSARNLALRRVATPWVAFLDADTVPADGWVERLEQWAARPDSPDGIEGAVRLEPGARATPFTHTTEAEEFGIHHVAFNVAFRTSVLREAGGFDERFFDPARRVHFREDTELYFRLETLGHRIGEDAGWVAFHPPLSASFTTPLRLARRYAFDPLLSREHPDRFTAFLRARKVGGFPLRWARHQAAVLHAAGGLVLIAAVLARRSGLGLAGAALFGTSWAANAAALSWRRQIDVRLLPQLIAVSALVPWVYLWSYYRGVVQFRHRPRLR
jgi:glycosyltransferase involved in cell wall biosynthesis